MNHPRIVLRLIADIADPELRAMTRYQYYARHDPFREERLHRQHSERQKRYMEKRKQTELKES